MSPSPEGLRVHDHRLTAPRLELRPMVEADWPTLLEWNQDPRVLTFWDSGTTEPWSLAKLQTAYRAISTHAYMFMIEEGGRPIGECWVQEMNLRELLDLFPGEDLRRIDLSIGDTTRWGQGLGTEVVVALVAFAFETLRADRLFACHVADSNPRSRRAFERAGFTEVESSRARSGPGDPSPWHHMGLARRAWIDRPRPRSGAGLRGRPGLVSP